MTPTIDHQVTDAAQGRRTPRRLSAEQHSKRAAGMIDRAADSADRMSAQGRRAPSHLSGEQDAADRIISMKATNAITGWSRGSTYRLVAAGLHPKPVKMGACKVGFVEREIREYVAAKLRGREISKPAAADAGV
jgi:prophage regulatory protein